MASESIDPDREGPAQLMRPHRKRDEMWLADRALLRLDPTTSNGKLRLHLDHTRAVQLSSPNMALTTPAAPSPSSRNEDEGLGASRHPTAPSAR